VPRSKATRERISTAIRLPVELHGALQRQAEERDVSVNYLVTRAVDYYLRRLGPADPLDAEPLAAKEESMR
jgi:predicted transcriptional regulator